MTELTRTVLTSTALTSTILKSTVLTSTVLKSTVDTWYRNYQWNQILKYFLQMLGQGAHVQV